MKRTLPRCLRMRVLAALALGGLYAVAQMNTGEVTGRIQDPSGAVLPGAVITAEQLETMQRFSTVSNQSGEYILPRLPAGFYSIKAAAENFKQTIVPRVELHAGDQLRRDFTLQIGETTEALTVEAGASGPQLESAEMKATTTKQQAVALPLKGRQFLDLAMLTEGVVRPPGGTRGDALQQAGTLVNVLGQRSGHNLYLLDGSTVTDEHFNNLVIAPSIDSIEEVNVQKTSYAPEFGGKSGAVINVVTRSGSNTWHGSLFEFLRNSAVDAKNFFDSPLAPIPPFRQNQFGGSLGGPVIRNRTFFFLSYEGQRMRKSLTQTFSVPTAAMRAGDLSGLPAIFDPNTIVNGSRAPFANNRIPETRIDPVAAGLLRKVPLPNLSGIAQNFRSTEIQSVNQNQYSARLDHQFSEKDTAFIRGSLFDAREFDPFGASVLQESLLPGFGRGLSTHAWNGVMNWTHVFNPSLFNESRFGFLTTAGGQTSPNAGNDFAAVAGLQGVTTNPADTGYPQVSFGGQFTTMGDPASFVYRTDRDFEFTDNVTIHRGTHTIKAGVYLMKFDFRPLNPNGARGIFSFTPRWTSSAPGLADGNAFADFLLGYPTAAQSGIGRAAMDATTVWAHFYVQDSWQVKPGLRVEAGLRYEHNQNMIDRNNEISAIDTTVPGGRIVIASDDSGAISPAAGALLSAIPVPFVSSAAAGWNRSLLINTGPRLAPRAGIAWNPGSGSKTVLRAGFGIYPNQAAYSIVTNLAQNPPFFVMKTVNAPVTLSPVFTTAGALATTNLGTIGGSTMDHNYRVEYNEVWNANVERELTPSTTLSLAYVGSRTVHADSSTVLNVPAPGPGIIAARRPIPELSQAGTIRWDGWASYNAFTAGVRRRMARGLTFDANWTWSHAIDDASDPGPTFHEANLPQNVYDRSSERASSSFDHRQRAVFSFVYQLAPPSAGQGWVRAALNGWQWSGNFTAQSGAPFTVNIASDQANIGAGPAQRPNVFADPNQGPKSPDEWFNTAVFSLPALYTFGNAPRNAVIGPGLVEFDMALQKEFAIRESARLEFRGEVYNLGNHPNFNIPNRTAFTPNFGKISSALDARQLQFAMRVVF
jgi:hypothetical protein